MHKYEIVYIFGSALTSEEIDSKLETFHSRLTKEAGQISAVEHWGKRQLAYPIEKERNGYYVVAQFETEPGSLADFERALKLDEQLLRYLIVLSEGELPFPPSRRRESDERARAPAPRDGRAPPSKPAADASSPEPAEAAAVDAEAQAADVEAEAADAEAGADEEPGDMEAEVATESGAETPGIAEEPPEGEEEATDAPAEEERSPVDG